MDIYSAVKDNKPLKIRTVIIDDTQETKSNLSSQTKTSKTSNKSRMKMAFLKKLSHYQGNATRKTPIKVEKDVENAEIPQIPLLRPETRGMDEIMKKRIE